LTVKFALSAQLREPIALDWRRCNSIVVEAGMPIGYVRGRAQEPEELEMIHKQIESGFDGGITHVDPESARSSRLTARNDGSWL